jgi:hypothetical protein
MRRAMLMTIGVPLLMAASAPSIRTLPKGQGGWAPTRSRFESTSTPRRLDSKNRAMVREINRVRRQKINQVVDVGGPATQDAAAMRRAVPVTMSDRVRRDQGEVALGAIVLSSLVLSLDSTILVTALPTLSTRLGATTDQLQWISTAYLLALSGLLIPAGVLADRLGWRPMLLAAVVVFGLYSVAASRMTTAGGLILMRAVLGVGGAFIIPISLAVLPTIFSERERPGAP